MTSKGFSKNPYFYFGLTSFVLSGLLFFGSQSLAELTANSEHTMLSSVFLKDANTSFANEDLFVNQNQVAAMETPDLKIIQDNFVYGISAPHTVTPQTFGAIMGGPAQVEERKEVIDYVVLPGDTIASVAANFNISVNTLLWANELSKNSALKVNQNLVILPVSGVLHVVKSGDTISAIAKTYKANIDEIISFNSLKSEGDIFIGDILIVPAGVMPQSIPASINVAPLADSFFIFPAEGYVSQGLHYYNGVDVANKCGTPIYATAAGTVQRAVANGQWNAGKGNYIAILHTNGVSTYYGHLMTLFVKSGDAVNVGDRIGLMGKTGETTGCHVHFQVMGAKNPLARYSVGAILKY